MLKPVVDIDFVESSCENFAHNNHISSWKKSHLYGKVGKKTHIVVINSVTTSQLGHINKVAKPCQSIENGKIN